MSETTKALVIQPVPMSANPREYRETLPAGLRARIWIKARHFFSRENAQDYCWLWLLDGDGRVHALRLDASFHGRDEFLPELISRLDASRIAPSRELREMDSIHLLLRAPVVPLTRWAVSWGHPVQEDIRAFAAELDAEVLAVLGRLEVPGPFFGSVGNYNRLALVPQPARHHRLQALEEFPPLIAPILLERVERPDMFGNREDSYAASTRSDREDHASVLEAMDRGRDLIGALAGHYRIGRALVRSPLFRVPTATGFVPRNRLRLLDAIPAHARPQEYKELQAWLPCLDALPVRARSARDVERLARVFAQGWARTWRESTARFRPLEPVLRDTRDFLHAALDEAELPPGLDRLDVEALGLGWLCRRGLLSLLEASRRWHDQPIIERLPGDGLPATVTPILGEVTLPEGSAMELATRHNLIDEGETMHHCVGGYWARCALHATRILHLQLAEGEKATAQYNWSRRIDQPWFKLAVLRGPCNREPSAAMRRFARRVEEAMNGPELEEARARAVQEAGQTSACHWPGNETHALRPLDARSRRELRLILAWCLGQEDWRSRPGELFRGPVAGFGHAHGPRLLHRLAAGDYLRLAREPTNPHDALAVRVDWNDRKIGYVPRPDNAQVARQLDAGVPLAAIVSAVRPDDDPWTQLEFSVAPADA
ncbi:MAG: HIRAN domain-containing protein [Gammaproteobacteria bacterium]|nr:HIRAN domain-containing protein [Gammaproteobacteria bacterium]